MIARKFKIRLFCLLFYSSGVFIAISAQESKIHFSHLTPENGLSQGHILSLLQDKEGYIWIGTYYGLNRYNGYSMKLFSLNKNDSNSIISDVVYTLYEDRDGFIWAGLVSGLDRFDKKTETFKHYLVNNNGTGLSDGYIKAIAQDKKGNIWIGTNNGGLNKLDQKTQRFTYYSQNEKGEKNLPDNMINDVTLSRNNTLWFTIDGYGIGKMNLPNEKITLITFSQGKPGGLPFTNVTCIFEDSKNNIWIGNTEGKLCQYNPQNDKFIVHDFLPAGYKTGKFRIRQIKESLAGEILIATDGAGLVNYNPNSRKALLNLHKINNSQTISSNEVRSILVDRSGTIFVGTYGRGISKYSNANNKFEIHTVTELNYASGDNNAFTACVEASRGRLVVGTYNGFFIFDTLTWEYQHILPGKTYADNKILTIAIAPDKTIWFGTNRQLHRYDENFNKIQSYTLINDNIDHPIYTIKFDYTKTLWLGLFVAEGLVKIPEAEWRNKSKKNINYKIYKNIWNDSTTVGGNQIWSIVEDHNKQLWIGNNINISVYNREKDNFRQLNFTNLAKSLVFDNYGNLWVATRGEGVYFYNTLNGQIKHYTSNDGLCQNFVFGAVVDKNNRIWLTSENGLSRFDPDNEIFRNYNVDDGLPSNRFDDRSDKLLSSGKIYMGTSNGFILFRPENIQNDTCKPNIVLSGLKIDNIPVYYDFSMGDSNIINTPIGQVKKFRFTVKQRDFTLEFAALHYSEPKKNNYKYMLEGFDKDWIYTDALHRSARYTNLSEGNYKFMVKASNADGVWNENPLELIITIVPPFYKTKQFILSIIFLFILSFFLVFNWRLKREIGQRKKLAQMVEDRTMEITEKNNILEANAVRLEESNKLLQERQQFIEEQKEELATQRDKLQHLIATKDKLFSIIAHDLKNPFNIIIGFSGLLIQNFAVYSDDKKMNVIKMLHQASHGAYSLLENLLQWSRSQSGNITFDPSKHNPKDLVESAIHHVTSFAENKGVTIKRSYNHEQPFIHADSNMVVAILRNLLLNAIKFSTSGDTINIKTSDSNGHIEFAVEDHGIGMPGEILGNLFKVEFNTSQIGTSGEKGTGLGLQICKDFVKLHKGKIWAKSEPAKGSTFFFTIPVNS
jgi:signal transduction histidine kinase/ligand-binding sensor domain-containing protein